MKSHDTKPRIVCSTLALGLALLLSGCGRNGIEPAHQWHERFVPTTDAERAAVAAMTEKIMSATPRSLSGHDQDWDDAIKAANDAALTSCCRPTMWEYANPECIEYGMRPTGHWRYSDQKEASK